MSKHLGALDKLYLGTAGQEATTELKKIKDVKISYSRESVDVSDRASGDWGSTIAGKKSCQLTFTYFDTNGKVGDADQSATDADLETILSAWHSNTLLSFKAVSLSGRGIDADWSVESIENDQTNEGAAVYNITCNINTDIRIPVECKAGAAA